MPGKYGFTLESIGIGPGDLYHNEDGDLRLKPDPLLEDHPEQDLEHPKPSIPNRSPSSTDH